MRTLKWMIPGLALVLAGAQFVQPERTNPPADPAASLVAVVKPPAQAAAVLERSCRDCHSNRTEWPWYSRVAPVSWDRLSTGTESRFTQFQW